MIFMPTCNRSESEKIAAERAVELIPKVTNLYPELKPYYLDMVLREQVDTNAPVVAEFQQELTRIIKQPTSVLCPEMFWRWLLDVCRWSFDKKYYSLVIQVMEGKKEVETHGTPMPHIYLNTNEDEIALAYGYMGTQRWQEALKIFDLFSNQAVQLTYPGPWGREETVIHTEKEAAYCAAKLGNNRPHDAREFKISPTAICMCAPSVFTMDQSGIWVAAGTELLQIDFDLKTNLSVALPITGGSLVSSICESGTSVWVGTDGEGLVEFDKTAHQWRKLTEKDGLMMWTESRA